MSTLILFPHQLFKEVFSRFKGFRIALIEPALFFTQFPFHKQKLILHRASMKLFADQLSDAGFEVAYFDIDAYPEIGGVAAQLKTEGVSEICYYDLADNWLEREVTSCFSPFATLEIMESPMFLTDRQTIGSFFEGKRRYRMAEFYTFQRRRLKILVDSTGKPEGGKWSFDTENRKKLPKNVKVHSPILFGNNSYVSEATQWAESRFPDNYGSAENFSYPITHGEATEALDHFLSMSLAIFGDYEDAMSETEARVFHSVLTPALNIGLLTPLQIVEATLDFASRNPIPLNSLEGFLRQIIGWREFVRAVYVLKGGRQRTQNALGFTNKIPEALWRGETGLHPIDVTLKRTLQTGYSHHIERLMLFGNLMLLCEIAPDEVYAWFMTLFIDAYDWVMVPNVYGMSQYADGGLMTTKPYVSGSAYIRRMSDYKNGAWVPIWDGLYWRFISRHRSLFDGNQRVSFATLTIDKMSPATLQNHLTNAEEFLTWGEKAP